VRLGRVRGARGQPPYRQQHDAERPQVRSRRDQALPESSDHAEIAMTFADASRTSRIRA
jgi:hypothetical protein